MPSSVTVIVGTRKGCFLLESDGDRRAWEVRGPFCDGWPVYHAIHDAATGALYAAAAASGTGPASGGARTAARPALSSEGLSYGEGDELKLSKVSGLTAAHGRLLAGAEAAGVFSSSDGGETWSLLSTLDGQPGRDAWNDPAKQPPGHLGVPRRCRIRTTRRASGRSCRASGSSRRPTTAPRGRRATAGSGPTGPRGSGGRLLRPQARHVAGRHGPALPAEPRRHAPERRRRPVVGRDHRGPPDGVRLRRSRASRTTATRST